MKALVTGGGGFVGSAVVAALLEEGYEVRSISRQHYPSLESMGAKSLVCELNERQALRAALQGCDTVVHVAAKTGVWGKYRDYYRTNVEGTRNLLAQAQAAGVKRIVYTSSPSVVFDGRDHVGATSLPYAAKPGCAYAKTKAIAERDVLGAHGRWGLVTCALRPHLVFGPGDPHLLPRIVERARAGRLPIVGDARNLVTMCYVENAGLAHALAARSLTLESPHAGRAYFIGQEEPVVLWSWLADVLQRLGVAPPTKRISRRAASVAGLCCEALWTLLRRASDPPMTRFIAAQLACSHAYDMAPARRDFGYRERVDMARGTERAIADLRARMALS